MSRKKTKSEKELSKLRRENEILKAQLKSKREKENTRKKAVEASNFPKIAANQKLTVTSVPTYLKADLTKTLFVTSLAIFLLSLIYYTENWWSSFF